VTGRNTRKNIALCKIDVSSERKLKGNMGNWKLDLKLGESKKLEKGKATLNQDQ